MKKGFSFVLLALMFGSCATSNKFGIKPGNRIIIASPSAIRVTVPEPNTTDRMVKSMTRRLNEQSERINFELDTVAEATENKIRRAGSDKESSEIEKVDRGELIYKRDQKPDPALEQFSFHQYLAVGSDGKQGLAPCDIIIATNKALNGQWRAIFVDDYKNGEIIIRWTNPMNGGYFTTSEWEQVNKDDLRITDYVIAPPALKARLCEPGKQILENCACH
jgi:hypothetical protein